jgi:predicted esterase
VLADRLGVRAFLAIFILCICACADSQDEKAIRELHRAYVHALKAKDFPAAYALFSSKTKEWISFEEAKATLIELSKVRNQPKIRFLGRLRVASDGHAGWLTERDWSDEKSGKRTTFFLSAHFVKERDGWRIPWELPLGSRIRKAYWSGNGREAYELANKILEINPYLAWAHKNQLDVWYDSVDHTTVDYETGMARALQNRRTILQTLATRGAWLCDNNLCTDSEAEIREEVSDAYFELGQKPEAARNAYLSEWAKTKGQWGKTKLWFEYLVLRLMLFFDFTPKSLEKPAPPSPNVVTPLNAPLPDDQVTRITANYTGDERVPELPTADQGTYHYDVYIPIGYAASRSRMYPCLFIADASGDAKMRTMTARIKRDKWIAIMLVESRNGPYGITFGNFLAAHDDAMKRLHCAPDRKFATGLSGGARAASVFVMFRPGFAGLLLQAASIPSSIYQIRPVSPGLRVFATFGKDDPNIANGDLNSLKTTDIHPSVPFNYEIFPGGHEWAPPEVIERAFDWFEQKTPKSNRK